jgi:hypothetical protein
MILPGETEAGTAGTQPCRGISRWAHRDDERRREVSFLRRPNLHRIERPHALKIPARRAEYSLTENVASPFQAEPTQPGNRRRLFLCNEEHSLSRIFPAGSRATPIPLKP